MHAFGDQECFYQYPKKDKGYIPVLNALKEIIQKYESQHSKTKSRTNWWGFLSFNACCTPYLLAIDIAASYLLLTSSQLMMLKKAAI